MSSRRGRSRRTRDHPQDLHTDPQDQAEEALEIQEEEEKIQSEGEGEDLQENLQRDYQPRPELDHYQQRGLDSHEYSDDPQAIRRAQQAIQARRARQHIHRGRYPGALNLQQLDYDNEILRRQQQRRRNLRDEDDDLQEQQQKFQKYMDLEQNRGKLSVLIKDDLTRRFIKRYFKKFLFTFKNVQKKRVYEQAIHEMCMNNSQSLIISYKDLQSMNQTLGLWITQQPMHIFPQLNRTLYQVCNKMYHGYEDIHKEVWVRFTQLPYIEEIRMLGHKQVGKLVSRVITRRSQVFSQLRQAFYICMRCGQFTDSFLSTENELSKPQKCIHCQFTGHFKLAQNNSIYRNHQKLSVQQSPTEVLPGRVPRQKQVILLGDNVDKVKPGDQVQISGVYIHRYSANLNAKMNYPVFATQIQCNYIRESFMIKQMDLIPVSRIKQISKTPQLLSKILKAIFPSIYGHKYAKIALLASLLGGVQINSTQHRVRGDINVIMVGDPGTAKSQLLKSIQAIAPRAVYTTGKGASAVGLTATVKKQALTQQWVLQGGAMVLADKGFCLIDQFDKMNEHDRSSIHQAMQQQSISIAKAGIVAKLNARCSVIAAANAIKGRYNSQMSFKDNVDLTQPIISRFDLMCVIKDEFDENIDDKMATFVLNSHMANHPLARKMKQSHNLEGYTQMLEQRTIQSREIQQQQQTITQMQAKYYLKYAREYCKPSAKSIQRQKVEVFYKRLRSFSNTGGIGIVVRHLESIIRISEGTFYLQAHAKLHLKNEVRPRDLDFGMRMILQSYVQTQKHSVSTAIKKYMRQFMDIQL